MKAVLVAFCMFLVLFASAQVEPCNIDPQYTQPGWYPRPDSLPCFVGDGEWNDITMQFVNFDSTTVSGIRVRVDYIIIDSILNLPCGIKWSSSKQNAATKHRFDNQERGCIRFWGVTNDTIGQYKLKIKVKARISLLPNEVPFEAENLGFMRVDVRLKNYACDPCPAIDTSSTTVLINAQCVSVDKDTLFWQRYSPDSVRCVGIKSIASINDFSFYPNPTNHTAAVTFTADKAAIYTARIINIYGAEVSREVLNVLPGEHKQLLEVSQLSPGVYIYTLNEGTKVLAHRFVVE